MQKTEIKSTFLKAKFGPSIDYGFVSIPNLLLEYASPVLHMNDRTVYFIIQLIWAMNKKREDGLISDSDLTMEASERTLVRIRKELTELKDTNGNNLVTIKPYYERNANGKIEGAGSHYDFSKLFDFLYSYHNSPICQNDTTVKLPTGQNDEAKYHNETPMRQNDKADINNDLPTGQNDNAISDKMAYINIDLDLKDYIDILEEKNIINFNKKINEFFEKIGLNFSKLSKETFAYYNDMLNNFRGNLYSIHYSGNLIKLKGNKFLNLAQGPIYRFLMCAEFQKEFEIIVS